METKLDFTDIVSLSGFSYISQPRKELSFRRSGGIALYVKNNIFEFCTEQPSESDYVLWVCLDKRLTDTDENVIFGIVYIPPSQSRFYNDDEMLKLENEIISVCSSNKYVILSGDFNARVGKLSDYIQLDEY